MFPFRREHLRFLILFSPLVFIAFPLIVFGSPLSHNTLSGWLDPFGIGDWFDPMFFHYNMVLLLFAILVIPIITYVYVRNMKEEKIRRLRSELTTAQWENYKEQIQDYFEKSFTFSNYWGSITGLSFVVAFGASTILLLKPVLITGGGSHNFGDGVNYGKGANILLLGPFISLFPDHLEDFYRHLILSLTAFNFGFLGAYLYFLSHLVRSYFTLDLTPHTFVASTIRMLTGSLLALVLSFGIVHYTDPNNFLISLLPVISFFCGYFPDRALVFLKKKVASQLGVTKKRYLATDLSELPGMSLLHEARLTREGYDNVENLSNARPIELVLRTGFGYRQLRQWIGQAWLICHLREDYVKFFEGTGLTSADDVNEFLENFKGDDPQVPLNAATHNQFPEKISIVLNLLPNWKRFMKIP